MAEENVLDMLNAPLSAEDLEPSLFPDGASVLFEVKAGKHDTSIDEVTGRQRNTIVFDLATCNPEKTSKGTEFPAGFPFTYRISLGTTAKSGRNIAELVKRNMAQFRAACGKPLDGQPLGSPEQYVGCRITAVMEIEQTAAYGRQSRISKFIAPATA